jgi:hypothetical protein
MAGKEPAALTPQLAEFFPPEDVDLVAGVQPAA